MEDSALSTVAHSARNATALAALLMVATPAAQAVGFGDMFNPGRWFGGGDNDDYYDDRAWGPYGPGPYGAYGAPGYAPYGGYGYGPYSAPGYAAPGTAYGMPGYASPAAPAPSESAPSGSDSESAKDREIEALKRRIEQLESRTAPPSRVQSPPEQGPNAGGWPSAPAFRPMDQY